MKHLEQTLERSSGTPLYVQLSQIIRQQIQSGHLPEGQLLPSITELAKQFGVSTITVRQALDLLSNEGLVGSTQGRGTYVIDPALAEPDKKKLSSVLYLEHHGISEWETFSREIKATTERVLREAGLDVQYGPIDSRNLKPFLRDHAHKASCIVLAAAFSFVEEACQSYPLPIVVFGEDPERLSGTNAKDVVNFGDYAGILELANYLVSLGHKKIATIHGPTDTYGGLRRLEAFQDALRQQSMKLNPEYVVDGHWEIAGGSEAAARLMSLDNPPTGIVCANDFMALGAMSYLQKAGISVPDDVSITGFDDIDMSAYASPSLTTMEVDRVMVGNAIAHLVLERLVNPAKRFTSVEFKPHIKIRESCKPCVK